MDLMIKKLNAMRDEFTKKFGIIANPAAIADNDEEYTFVEAIHIYTKLIKTGAMAYYNGLQFDFENVDEYWDAYYNIMQPMAYKGLISCQFYNNGEEEFISSIFEKNGCIVCAIAIKDIRRFGVMLVIVKKDNETNLN